jgi:tripartite-type tricarboxylate transporter receptor subunit TctC
MSVLPPTRPARAPHRTKGARATRRRLLGAAAGAGLLAALPVEHAKAQAFPSRPITLIVPFPAGGVTDVQFRALAQIAAKEFGQPVVISNRPGATGTLAPGQMAGTAAPDGYTLSVVSAGQFRMPHVSKVPWDPLQDFTWILGVTAYSFGVAVRTEAPWKTFADLVADAKANPGKLTMGTSGRGNVGHVAMEKVSRSTGMKMTLVPFKGAAEFMAALVGGHIDVVPDGGWGTMARAGKVRLLAMMTPKRLPSWPDVPTLKELGYDIEVLPMLMIAGPKGMDPAVVKRLHDGFRKAMADPAFQKVLDADNQTVIYMDAEACRRYGAERFEEERRIVAEFGLAQPQ